MTQFGSRGPIGLRSPTFLGAIKTELEAGHDLLIWRRLNRGGGQNEWFLVTRDDQLEEVFRRSRPGDSYIVYGAARLPIRGVVDDNLIDRVVGLVSDVPETLLLEVLPSVASVMAKIGAEPGDTEEIRDWLLQRLGKVVLAGPWPEDTDEVTAAYAEDSDGQIRIGAY
jgi:hypothetical protein